MKNCSVYILKDTEVTSHNRLIRWVTNGRQCSAMQAPFARFVCFEIARFVCFEISRFRARNWTNLFYINVGDQVKSYSWTPRLFIIYIKAGRTDYYYWKLTIWQGVSLFSANEDNCSLRNKE